MRHYLVVEVSGCTGPDRPGLAAARRRACIRCAGKNACGPELRCKSKALGTGAPIREALASSYLDDGSYEICGKWKAYASRRPADLQA
jgi:hypothetical protein